MERLEVLEVSLSLDRWLWAEEERAWWFGEVEGGTGDLCAGRRVVCASIMLHNEGNSE